ncbi:MAG: type II secretion system protein GspM [Candidatus Omnitrophota bacterium]
MIKVLNKRERGILYLAVSVFLIAVCFNFIISPLLSRNAALNKEINTARSKLKRYLRLLNQKEQIKNKYTGRLNAPEGIAENPLALTLAELDSLAKDANIRIIDIRPQATTRSKEVVVDLRAEGALEDFMKFIYDVETSLALLQIKRLQFSSKPETAGLEAAFSISQILLD